MTKEFEAQLSRLINEFSKVVDKTEKIKVNGIGSDSFKIGRLAWLHTIYYFCKPQYFRQYGGIKEQLKENISKDFSFLISQVPHEMSSSMERYIFFGTGRSIIVTKFFLKEEIIRLVRLLESYQYFYFGLFQLDNFLLAEMYKTKIGTNHDENASEEIDGKLETLSTEIKQFENLRFSTIRYLEQFRYGSNVLILAGERSLIQELENQWGLDDLEKGIRNKLDLFDKELSSIEQALLAKKQEKITEEQNYLNRLILLVTLISLASVTAQLLLLSPVADIFKEQSNVLYKTELYMVLLSSAIIILMALSFYSQKLRTKISKLILKRQDNIENNQRSQKYKQDKS